MGSNRAGPVRLFVDVHDARHIMIMDSVDEVAAVKNDCDVAAFCVAQLLEEDGELSVADINYETVR